MRAGVEQIERSLPGFLSAAEREIASIFESRAR